MDEVPLRPDKYSQSRPFQLARRLQSFGHAARGIRRIMMTEHNAWIHAIVTIVVIVLGTVLGVSRTDWCWLTVAMTIVWVAEGLNTAIEYLCDSIRPETDPRIGDVKDIAAGAVLISAIGAAIVGLIVLGPKLWDLVIGTASR